MIALAARYWNSPDVVFVPPDEMECRGQQQLHDFFMNTIQSVPGAKLELARQKYTVAGDCVIGDGRFTMKPPGGEAMSGRFTEVFAKKDGKWVIIVDHASVPAAGR